MTSLEQLSLAAFSSGSVRQKVYENGHKNVLGIWIDLEQKVKLGTFLALKVENQKVKNQLNPPDFSLIEEKLLLMTYFANCNF